MTNCPCCYRPMIQHFRHRQTVWFCRHCWQEMPDPEMQTIPYSAFLNMQLMDELVEQPRLQQLELVH